jgi:hypothetical protein
MTKPYHVQMTLDGHIDLVDNVTGQEYDGFIDDSDPEPIRDWTEFDVFPGETLTEYGAARLADGEPDHHPVDRRITVKYQMEFVVPDGEWFEYDRLSGYGDWLGDEARFDFGDWFTGLQAHTHTEGE